MATVHEIKKEILSVVTIASIAGTRSTRMQCPFHHSESLDLQLFHEENRWKCWGKCNTAGNIFDWIMLQDGVDFKTAFKQLAEYAGIPLTNSSERSEILNLAQDYFHESLLQNKEALLYLRKRGFSKEHIFRRKIGFSGLHDFPSNVPIRKLEQVGLIRTGTHGLYPYFRNRIVYPIYDRNFDILQLQGRSIEPDVEPKYLALPQGVELPGRSIWQCLAGEEILRDTSISELWLCEGWPDRETLAAWGIPALGLFGHSGLEKHSYQLDGLTKVYVCLDNDEASQKTLLDKLYLLAMKIPKVEFVITLLPEGVDINDFAREGRSEKEPLNRTRDSAKIEELYKIAEQSKPFIEVLINKWTEKHYMVEPLVKLIAKVPDNDKWIYTLSKKLGESEQSIKFLMKVLANSSV
jgi:DNA primase